MISREHKEQIVKIFNDHENVHGMSLADRGVLWDILLEKFGEPFEYTSFGATFLVKNSENQNVKLFVDGSPDLGDYIRSISTIHKKIDLNSFFWSIDKLLEEIEQIVNIKDGDDVLEKIREIEENLSAQEQARILAAQMIEETYQNDVRELETRLNEVGVDLNHIAEITSRIS